MVFLLLVIFQTNYKVKASRIRTGDRLSKQSMGVLICENHTLVINVTSEKRYSKIGRIKAFQHNGKKIGRIKASISLTCASSLLGIVSKAIKSAPDSERT